MKDVRIKRQMKDDYFNAGPLATVFEGDSKARILDQSLLLGNAEFTVSMLKDGTDLSYKTVRSYLEHLTKIGWVIATRKMGNAQAYRFNLENHMSGLINWATDMQNEQLARQVSQESET